MMKVDKVNTGMEDTGNGSNSKKEKTATKSSGRNMRRSETTEIPIFLKKTYHMIDSCDPAVATWSNSGDAFVVKDPDIFASTVIPRFFKHSNFSSFVRQLNFYGFRKIKAESLRLAAATAANAAGVDVPLEDEAEALASSKHWQFRHEKFKRNRPDLLSEIRRATHYGNGPDQQDVDNLKNEVFTLRNRVTKISTSIDSLTNMVQNMMKEKNEREDHLVKEKALLQSRLDALSSNKFTDPSTYGKKRKVDVSVSYDSSDNSAVEEKTPLHVSSIDCEPSPVWSMHPIVRGESAHSGLTTLGDDFVDTMFTDLELDTSVNSDDPMLHLPHDTSIVNSSANPEAKGVDDLRNCLALLPRQMQDRFVDRLVATITDAGSLKSHMDAATSVSENACDHGKESATVVNVSNAAEKQCQQPKVTIPAAAAALSAFLKYNCNDMKNPQAMKSKPTIVQVLS